jgi:hypothetical protein
MVWLNAVPIGSPLNGRRKSEQAAALGWTARDLFGLHMPPEHPHPSYDRLCRYDQTGLDWLLCGRPVVALTATSAAKTVSSTGNSNEHVDKPPSHLAASLPP